MSGDNAAFYAAQARLRDEADAEWAALGGRLGPFRLTDDLDAWAAGLGDDSFRWESRGYRKPSGRGPADLAAQAGADRAYAAPPLLAAATRDGVLVPPIPGRLVSAFANRHPEGEYETALGYGFEPDAAPTLLLWAGRAVPFEAFDTPPDTPPGAVAAHVVRLIVATLDGWRVHIRPARLREISRR